MKDVERLFLDEVQARLTPDVVAEICSTLGITREDAVGYLAKRKLTPPEFADGHHVQKQHGKNLGVND